MVALPRDCTTWPQHDLFTASPILYAELALPIAPGRCRDVDMVLTHALRTTAPCPDESE